MTRVYALACHTTSVEVLQQQPRCTKHNKTSCVLLYTSQVYISHYSRLPFASESPGSQKRLPVVSIQAGYMWSSFLQTALFFGEFGSIDKTPTWLV